MLQPLVHTIFDIALFFQFLDQYETSHHEMNFHAYFNPSKKTKKDERETLQISKKKSKQKKVNFAHSGSEFRKKMSNFEGKP